ncbi:hypothetical protein CBF23_009455 [Marinomonas agarivorans]|nr:hypothetical protein CBF23_009455 [Marinomonas agarivorans]
MTTSDQALFSRPVLAILMVVVTLLIWILNATAPESRFSQPIMNQWQTPSKIPVTWLDQSIWQGTNKLEVRIRFNHGRSDDVKLGLTDALFSLLLLDTLPLSTSSINKRLESTTAKVNYHVSEDNSELAITLNTDSPYLNSSLSILTSWLATPIFKQRTFINWQKTDNSSLQMEKRQLVQHLFPVTSQPTMSQTLSQNKNGSHIIGLGDINAHYQFIQNKVDKVTLVGHIPEPDALKAQLNTLLMPFHPSSEDRHITVAKNTALHTQIGETLTQSHGAIAFDDLEQVTDWISLQIWLRHLASKLHNSPITAYSQLHLERSNLRQWAWWSTQHEQTLLQDDILIESKVDDKDEPKKHAVKQDRYAAKDILETSLHSITAAEFDHLLEGLKDRIARQSKSPTWWARIASQETPDQQPLNVTRWLENYAAELESMNLEKYQQSIQKIVLVDSYQEIQIRE